MSKKSSIVLIVLGLALLAGGFFVFQQIQAGQQREAYQKSSDKIADDLISAVAAHDVARTTSYFSAGLRSEYSESYWKDTIFAELQNYEGTPTRHAKGPVQPASSDAPNRYDPQLKQEATQYEYDFANVNSATYRLTIVIFRENNAWRVNELRGGYLP